MNTSQQKIIAAALLGAIGGGLIVAIATKALPKIMAGMMATMMERMEGSCDCLPEN